MALVYRHRRLDTDEIFYIGIELDSNKRKASGLRSNKKSGRSSFWKNIINKTEYEIEIIYNNISNEEAKELEEFLISLYGRKDLGLGTLVNLTNGGDGSPGCILSAETKQKISNSLKGKNLGINNGMYGKPTKLKPKFGKDNPMFKNTRFRGGKSSCAKKVIDISTNQIWNCIKDCSDEHNLKKTTLTAWLNGQNKNKSNFRYFI